MHRQLLHPLAMFTALSGALALASCSELPRTDPVPFTGASEFHRSALSEARRASQGGSTAAPAGPAEPIVLRLSLDACFGLMETGSRSAMLERINLAVADANVLRASAATDIVFNSQLSLDRTRRPLQSQLATDTRTESIETTVDASAGVTVPFESGTTIEANHGFRQLKTNSPFNRFEWDSDFTLTVRQKLLDGFGLTSGAADREIAEQDRVATRGDVSHALLGVRYSVAEAYWNLVLAREELAVLERQRDSARISARSAERRQQEGLDSQLDVLRARSTLTARERDIIAQELEVRRDSDALLRAISPDLLSGYALVRGYTISVEPVDTLVGEFAAVPVPDAYSQLQSAVKRRTDLQAAVARVEAAGVRLRQRDQQQLPQLDLTTGLVTRGSGVDFGRALDGVVGADGTSFQASLLFEIPLGNAADLAAFQIAQADLERAMIQLRDAETDVIVEVVDAIREIETGNRSVAAARQAADLAREEHAAAVFRKTIDRATSLEIKEAEAEMTARQRDLLRERVGLELARLRLVRATGGAGG